MIFLILILLFCSPSYAITTGVLTPKNMSVSSAVCTDSGGNLVTSGCTNTGTIGGSISSGQVAYGTGTNTIGGTSNATLDLGGNLALNKVDANSSVGTGMFIVDNQVVDGNNQYPILDQYHNFYDTSGNPVFGLSNGNANFTGSIYVNNLYGTGDNDLYLEYDNSGDSCIGDCGNNYNGFQLAVNQSAGQITFGNEGYTNYYLNLNLGNNNAGFEDDIDNVLNFNVSTNTGTGDDVQAMAWNGNYPADSALMQHFGPNWSGGGGGFPYSVTRGGGLEFLIYGAGAHQGGMYIIAGAQTSTPQFDISGDGTNGATYPIITFQQDASALAHIGVNKVTPSSTATFDIHGAGNTTDLQDDNGDWSIGVTGTATFATVKTGSTRLYYCTSTDLVARTNGGTCAGGSWTAMNYYSN